AHARRVDLERHPHIDDRLKGRAKLRLAGERVVGKRLHRSIPLWEVDVPDGVEPTGLGRGLDLLEVWLHYVDDAARREVFREDDFAQIPVVNGADDKVELVLAKEVLHLPH